MIEGAVIGETTQPRLASVSAGNVPARVAVLTTSTGPMLEAQVALLKNWRPCTVRAPLPRSMSTARAKTSATSSEPRSTLGERVPGCSKMLWAEVGSTAGVQLAASSIASLVEPFQASRPVALSALSSTTTTNALTTTSWSPSLACSMAVIE